MGDTKVICTAKLEERVPPFLRNSGKGWITAEYGMLPGSSQSASVANRRAAKSAGGPTRFNGSSAAVCAPIADLKVSASAPSGSTVTSFKPMAARAPRRSPALTSRWREAVRRWLDRGVIRRRSPSRCRGGRQHRHCRWKVLLDLVLRGRQQGRCRYEFRHDRLGLNSSKCKARRKARRFHRKADGAHGGDRAGRH